MTLTPRQLGNKGLEVEKNCKLPSSLSLSSLVCNQKMQPEVTAKLSSWRCSSGSLIKKSAANQHTSQRNSGRPPLEGQRRPARRYRPDEIEARVEREGRTPGGAATCCLLIDVCLCCQQITAHHRSSRHELDRAIRIPDTSSAPPSTTTRLLAEAPCRLFVVEPDSCRRLHSSCFDCNQRLSTPTRRRRRGTEWTTWIMEKAALHSTRVYWTLVTLFQYILFRRTFPSLKDT